MSAAISTVTAPRQSGLKKPKPLRSMSLITENQKTEFVSPVSGSSAECVASASIANQPVSRKIAAMSALLVAEVEEKTASDLQQQRLLALRQQAGVTSTFLTSKQPVASTAPLYVRANSTPDHTSEDQTSRPQLYRRFSAEESISAIPSGHVPLPQHTSLTSTKCATLHPHAGERVPSRESTSERRREMSPTRAQSLQQGVPSSTVTSHNHSSALTTDCKTETDLQNLGYLANRIVVATLKTPKGEKFVLSAESIQTIISVTKVLVSQLGAKIEKLETFPQQDTAQQTEPLQTAGNPPVSRLPSHREDTSQLFKNEAQSSVLSGCRNSRYSKDQLLQLSQSLLSKQPPSSWRLLSQSHPEICLPASKIRHFFDPLDYCPGSGNLIVRESQGTNRGRDN